MYIYTHICIYSICTYTHLYRHTHMHTYMSRDTHIYVYTYICIHVCTYIYMCVSTRTSIVEASDCGCSPKQVIDMLHHPEGNVPKCLHHDSPNASYMLIILKSIDYYWAYQEYIMVQSFQKTYSVIYSRKAVNATLRALN